MVENRADDEDSRTVEPERQNLLPLDHGSGITVSTAREHVARIVLVYLRPVLYDGCIALVIRSSRIDYSS